jgi:type II secretory pathway pseudopilin PulG
MSDKNNPSPITLRTRNGLAFTLIEILVVIGIIGTLAVLLLPAVVTAKRLARIVKCQSNLHGAGVAVQMYLNQSDGVMPVAAQMPSLALNDDPAIAEVLGPWLSYPELLRCPADVTVDYYGREGSSYEYHTMLSGTQVGRDLLSNRWGDEKSPVLHDYEPFHGPPGKSRSTNFLFVNGQVGDLE